jgi:serine-type D-Ala-D-Ala carboxypeptidase
MQLRVGRAEEVGMSPQRVARVKALAQKWVDEGVTPALGVLVARRGVVVLHEAFGVLTAEPDAPPLQRDTIFPLASLTKPVTATCVMILVEDGLLGLNRPVAEYIPEFVGEGKEAVMVHHLLTHTSGLTEDEVWKHIQAKYDENAVTPAAEPTQHPMHAQWLYYGYDALLTRSPGVEMSYSNYGIELLGEIVRRVSGQSLNDFARERLFAPLGMQDTWYSVPHEVNHRIVKRPATAPLAGPESPGLKDAQPHVKELLEGLNSRKWQEVPLAWGGLYSTVQDMAIFGQMFLNRGCYGDVRILSPATVREMTRNQIPGISAEYFGEYFPEASWGLGWTACGDKKSLDEGTLRSPATFSHTGAGGIQLWVDPDQELVGVYFSVVPKVDAGNRHIWPVDLFMNAVTASLIDG